MKRTIYLVGILVGVIMAGAAVFWGCNNEGGDQGVASIRAHQRQDVSQYPQGKMEPNDDSRSFTLDDQTSAVILFRGSAGRDLGISSVSSDQNAELASQWLTEQGYSFTDSNSIVFVISKYHNTPIQLPTENTNGALLRPRPDPIPYRYVVESDTIVWRAFENPTHSMAVHTALITGWSNQGQKMTALLELDVTTPIPTEIRKGQFRDGVFAPGDLNTDGIRSCFLLGSGGAALGCLASNCGWAVCTAFGIGGAGLACVAAGFFGWL
jgi:hypothetical protein